MLNAHPHVIQPRARAIVAEDDPAFLELLGEALGAAGFEPFLVRSGGELLRAVERFSLERYPKPPVDLIVTDLRMPRLSGLDALRWIRAGRWDVPAILLTAFADDALDTEAARVGATLVAKPVRLDALTCIAEMLLRRHPAAFARRRICS